MFEAQRGKDFTSKTPLHIKLWFLFEDTREAKCVTNRLLRLKIMQDIIYFQKVFGGGD